MGLLLADVHRFKAINDSYGHQIGDRVLIELARRLRANTRDSEMIARYGGDEFVVVLPEADLDVLRRVALRVRSAIWDVPFQLDGDQTLAVAVGLGAVTVGDFKRAKGPEHVLAVGDKLLYATKHKRDRRICLLRI